MLRFRDRAHAASLLMERVKGFEQRTNPLVLALPRGGVPVGHGVATPLGVDLDVLVVRKVSHPQEPEIALGAVALGGVQILNPDIIANANLDAKEFVQLVQEANAELSRREALYRSDRSPLRVWGRSVMIVDDGIATGATMLAAIRALRARKAREIVVAAPVSSEQAYERLQREADEVITLVVADEFLGVSQFYEHFEQVTDDEVCRLLREERKNSSQGTLERVS